MFCKMLSQHPDAGIEKQIYSNHMRNEHPNGTLIVTPNSYPMIWFEWAMSYAAVKKYGPESRMYEDPQPVVDMARNNAVDFAINAEIPYIFFWDGDIILPKDAIYRLMRHRKDIVSGLVARRHLPTTNLMLVEVMDQSQHEALMPIHEGEYPREALINVGCVATGCLLIKTDILREIERPYFSWGVGKAHSGRSEDYSFMKKLRRHSISVYCDTSLIGKHINYGKILPTKDPMQVTGKNFEFPTVGVFE